MHSGINLQKSTLSCGKEDLQIIKDSVPFEKMRYAVITVVPNITELTVSSTLVR